MCVRLRLTRWRAAPSLPIAFASSALRSAMRAATSVKSTTWTTAGAVPRHAASAPRPAVKWPVPVCVTEKSSVCSRASQPFARAASQGPHCDTRDDADCRQRAMNPRADSPRPLLARVTGLRHALLHIGFALVPDCASASGRVSRCGRFLAQSLFGRRCLFRDHRPFDLRYSVKSHAASKEPKPPSWLIRVSFQRAIVRRRALTPTP